MGAMTPPSRKSCYNFRVTSIDRVLDGDTIDVTIDLGFDLYKKERVRVAGVDTPEKRTREIKQKAGLHKRQRNHLTQRNTVEVLEVNGKQRYDLDLIKRGAELLIQEIDDHD